MMGRLQGFFRQTFLRLAGASLVGLSLVLTGCSSNVESSATADNGVAESATEVGTDSASIVATAGATTIAAGTARFSMDGSTDARGGGSGLQTTAGSYTMQGSIDFENGKSEVKVVPGEVGEAGAVKIITVGDIQYVQLGATDSDEWIKSETKDPGTGDSVSVPLNVVGVLKDIGDPIEVGTDSVEGVPATKYTGTVEAEQALVGAGIPVGESHSEMITGDAEISVWIDDQGRIVKTEHRTSAEVGRTEIDTTVSVRLFDFGASLDIQAPPPAEVHGS